MKGREKWLPSERHINRQVQWRTELQKYGCKVNLERTVHIRGAKVVVDVYAEVDDKIFLIEIGDIEDERKTALMQYFAREKPNVKFLHESYGENKIPQVLESLASYRNSAEYKKIQKLREYRQKILREYKQKMILSKQKMMQSKIRKPKISDSQLKFVFGILTAILASIYMLVLISGTNKPIMLPTLGVVPLCLAVWVLLLLVIWKKRNTLEHTKYDWKLERELKTLEEKLGKIDEKE